jgi:uncharacterized C2H2 Zn-finger protein
VPSRLKRLHLSCLRPEFNGPYFRICRERYYYGSKTFLVRCPRCRLKVKIGGLYSLQFRERTFLHAKYTYGICPRCHLAAWLDKPYLRPHLWKLNNTVDSLYLAH